jgi:hypothetical protein
MTFVVHDGVALFVLYWLTPSRVRIFVDVSVRWVRSIWLEIVSGEFPAGTSAEKITVTGPEARAVLIELQPLPREVHGCAALPLLLPPV